MGAVRQFCVTFPLSLSAQFPPCGRDACVAGQEVRAQRGPAHRHRHRAGPGHPGQDHRAVHGIQGKLIKAFSR